MKIRPSVLIIKDNKLLTLKYRYPKGDIYALPGGNLEFGEELKPALQRELLEEIGIEAQVGDLKFICEVIYQRENTIHFVFLCDSYFNEPIINPKETKANEIVWLPLEKLTRSTLYPNISKYIPLDSSTLPIQFLGLIEQVRY